MLKSDITQNALRMEMFTNFPYYYGGKFPNDIPTPSHKAHVTHCLEVRVIPNWQSRDKILTDTGGSVAKLNVQC
jgi:hypothetical protein